jgi:hypothetical protein
MKKQIMMTGWCLMALAANVRAQFLDGIFSQSGTQRKVYEAQIAALKLFSSKVQEGYQIVEKGLSDIREIRQGEFGLHQAFFSGLSSVNPALAKMPEVEEVLTLQAWVVNGFSEALQRWKQEGGLTAEELAVIGRVYAKVCEEGVQDMQALQDVMTAGTLSMPDGQRMLQIRELDANMKDRYVFVQIFLNETDLLAAHRRSAAGDARVLKRWNGLLNK